MTAPVSELENTRKVSEQNLLSSFGISIKDNSSEDDNTSPKATKKLAANHTTDTKLISNNDSIETLDPYASTKGSDADSLDEIRQLEENIRKCKAPQDLKDKLDKMIMRLKRMTRGGGYNAEYESIAKYINWVTQIPFGTYTEDKLDLHDVKATLDSSHYGLERVKEKILEYISVIKLQTDKGFKANGANEQDVSENMSKLRGSSANAPVILFVGIQGIGKTSITKSIANALGRKMIRIPLGALADTAMIKGRSLGYPDAEPGLITKALVRSEAMNPLLLLDEIDKVSDKAGARADLMAALLEILDPEQNATFMDHYIDYPLDLSKTMIVCTANNLGGITAAVLDRLEIIRLSSYTDDEKKSISKNYLLPKVREATGLDEDQLVFADDVWDYIIRPLGFDAGVRQLERTLANLARKIARKIVMGEGERFEINKDNFRDFIPEEIGVYS